MLSIPKKTEIPSVPSLFAPRDSRQNGLAKRRLREQNGAVNPKPTTEDGSPLPPGAVPASGTPAHVAVPFMGSTVVAGFPSPAEQYVERPLDLNELLVARPAATYFVRAQGDSMEGAGIRSGDLLVVDRSLPAADGSVVIAAVDGDFTVKTLRRGPGGEVLLEAANPGYAPIRFSGEMELRVFGVVTAVIHRLAPDRP